MSKEIDFSKAPEGATHYREVHDHVDWHRKTNSGWQYWRASSNSWCYVATWFDSALPIPQQWSIYTNDKPLSELSDEQAAALFNAWRGGGNMQYLNEDEEWKDYNSGFYPLDTYRIKPKSERELFIDAAMQLIMTSETERTLEQQFGALFDSGKFKLVEQPK